MLLYHSDNSISIAAIRIGFTQSSYNITRSQYYEDFYDIVKIAKEGPTEQTFHILIEAVSAVPPSSTITPVSDEVIHNIISFSHHRAIVTTFDSTEQEKGVDIYVNPSYLPPETVGFQLVISSEQDPFFVSPKNLFLSTYVIIH